MLTPFCSKGQLELPTKCSLGKVKLETMLASHLDCSGSAGEAQVLKLKGLMTLQGSNCWISLHNIKCGVLRLSCLVPINFFPIPPSPPFFGKCVLYFISTDQFGQCDGAGVKTAYWLPWIHCVYSLMCLASPFFRVPSPNLIYC